MRPNFVIDYDMPGTNSESRFTEFSAPRVHFVMHNRDNTPMVLAMAVLDLPKRCSAPTHLVRTLFFVCASLLI